MRVYSISIPGSDITEPYYSIISEPNLFYNLSLQNTSKKEKNYSSTGVRIVQSLAHVLLQLLGKDSKFYRHEG